MFCVDCLFAIECFSWAGLVKCVAGNKKHVHSLRWQVFNVVGGEHGRPSDKHFFMEKKIL